MTIYNHNYINEMKPYIYKSGENTKDYYYEFSLINFEDMPIVFVCRDIENNVYLCNCVESRNYQKWIVAKTTKYILLQLIEQKITLFEALKGVDNIIIKVIRNYKNDSYEHQSIDINELKNNEIPDKKAMVLYLEDNVRQHIEQLNETKNDNYIYKNEFIENVILLDESYRQYFRNLQIIESKYLTEKSFVDIKELEYCKIDSLKKYLLQLEDEKYIFEIQYYSLNIYDNIKPKLNYLELFNNFDINKVYEGNINIAA